VHWLQQKDQNTKFFNNKATQRKRKNQIHSIQDSLVNTWKDNNHIQSCFLSYYQDFFSSKIQNINSDSLSVFKNRISPTDFHILNTYFSATKVREAIKSLMSNSSPGLDGLPTHFYQQYWNIIGSNILDFVLNILTNGGNVTNINHTFNCLIPKISSPSILQTIGLSAFAMSLSNLLLKILLIGLSLFYLISSMNIKVFFFRVGSLLITLLLPLKLSIILKSLGRKTMVLLVLR